MKRFTDTKRFDESWYHGLPASMKLAWEYIWAKCDNAGVWDVNTGLCEYQIREKVKWDLFLEKTAGRIVRLSETKWHVRDFVSTQFGKLSAESRVHQSVITLLRSHGLLGMDSLSIAYPEAIQRLSDSLIIKEQVQGQEPNKGQEPAREDKRRGTREEVRAYFAEQQLPESDADAFFDSHVSSGWKTNGSPIVCWRAKVRSWKSAGYHPSQKNGAKLPPSRQQEAAGQVYPGPQNVKVWTAEAMRKAREEREAQQQ